MTYEKVTDHNRERVTAFIQQHWYTTTMVVRGKAVDMTRVEGYLCQENHAILGLVTFLARGAALEIVSLNSMVGNRGIGGKLVSLVVEEARARGCHKVVLVATNDNINAIRFYQKQGFDMARLHRNALDLSRKLKPEIPLIGENGIPMRHEIEFEKVLD